MIRRCEGCGVVLVPRAGHPRTRCPACKPPLTGAKQVALERARERRRERERRRAEVKREAIDAEMFADAERREAIGPPTQTLDDYADELPGQTVTFDEWADLVGYDCRTRTYRPEGEMTNE